MGDYLKIRVVSDGTSENTAVFDVESGRQLPCLAIEFLPISAGSGVLKARVTMYLRGGVDIGADAEIKVFTPPGELT